jgi:urease accessory protein
MGMPEDSRLPSSPLTNELAYLKLLHLADSALPIGALAHSFGLETLAAAGELHVENLAEFLGGYLQESGVLEAAFCRDAFRRASVTEAEFDVEGLLRANERLAAMKPGRESRAGSAALGQNLLQLVASLGDAPAIRKTLEACRSTGRTGDAKASRSVQRASAAAGANGAAVSRVPVVQHSIAFGLAAGALGLDESSTALAFLHQMCASLVSACQRLLPLGQTRAAKILWELKPAILAAAERSAKRPPEEIASFTPLADWGAMQHPSLATRLFIS